MNKEIENIIKNWNDPATLSHEEIKSLIEAAIKQERERIIEEIRKSVLISFPAEIEAKEAIEDIIKDIK